ncbi:MAG: hypothetical protein HRU19_11760 [Pseudobacteriovorax sp.]|nr:hypothetical protein [Pseudobacteriovorax sp.]
MAFYGEFVSQNSIQQPKQSRKRFLNIIYFVDSNKTKTFKLSLKSSYIVGIFLVASMIWSVTSTVLLIKSYSHDIQQTDRVKKLLSTIFTYQTRYDGIYEKSYPTKAKTALSQTKGGSGDSVTADADKADSSTSKTGTNLAAKKLITPDSDKTQNQVEEGKKTAVKEDNVSTKEGIKIDKYEPVKSDRSFSLSFAVKNLDRPTRTHGYVIGFASFKTASGEVKVISSPSDITESQAIKPWELPRDHRFAIKYYTRKTLNFEVPKELTGTMESIKIVVNSKHVKPLTLTYKVDPSLSQFQEAAGAN